MKAEKDLLNEQVLVGILFDILCYIETLHDVKWAVVHNFHMCYLYEIKFICIKL